MEIADLDFASFNLTVPELLTESNIHRINEDSVGVYVVSKFYDLTYTGALAIEAGNIKSGLLTLAKTFESSFFFRYRSTKNDEESIRLRDAIRTMIVIRKLGE
jgi:hypothetical protein